MLILKRISTITSPILANFYNAFMSSGTFPNVLKTSIVSPVYKKGNPQQFYNYKPISTLSIFSKLFEKLIYKLIKNILYEKQFGFRKIIQLLMLLINNYSVKYVTDNIEQKKHVIGIFLDLSKAFDTICHSKLLYKLQNYGIRGSCLAGLRSNYKLSLFTSTSNKI